MGRDHEHMLFKTSCKICQAQGNCVEREPFFTEDYLVTNNTQLGEEQLKMTRVDKYTLKLWKIGFPHNKKKQYQGDIDVRGV